MPLFLSPVAGVLLFQVIEAHDYTRIEQRRRRGCRSGVDDGAKASSEGGRRKSQVTVVSMTRIQVPGYGAPLRRRRQVMLQVDHHLVLLPLLPVFVVNTP